MTRPDPQHLGDRASPSQPSGCLPVLLRITWLMWGNFALFACAAMVAHGMAPVLSDALLFLVAGGLIAVRYVDITRFAGETSDGEPATRADWRRYTVTMLFVSTTLWGLARFVAVRGWL